MTKTDPRAFGARLEVARGRALLTQRELAEKSGVHEVTISLYENGKGNPRVSTVRALAEALGVDPSWLMFGEMENGRPE